MFTIYLLLIENWKELEKLIIQHKDVVHDYINIVDVNGLKLYEILFGIKHKKSTERLHGILSGHEE